MLSEHLPCLFINIYPRGISHAFRSTSKAFNIGIWYNVLIMKFRLLLIQRRCYITRSIPSTSSIP
jgi:hypothetical protein